MTWILLAAAPAIAGAPLPDRLAERATAPDVVLMPPIGEPSPQAGSFVIQYAPEAGTEPDPKLVGTYEVGPSSCSEALVFKSVSAAETRTELWMIDSGIGARLGLPQFGLSASLGHKSLAGLSYEVTEKLIVDDGLAELEACCLRSPETCTTEYVAEVWKGTGSLHRMTSSSAAIKTSLRQLDQLGQIDFGGTKGWTAASEWSEPMYFAYRTQAFQRPSCQSFMNDLPERDGQMLFTGVSERVPSEQDARRNAREDARAQVARYLGEQVTIRGDVVFTSADALVSGVKDSLTCLDEALETPEGPHYLARVRMYVDGAALDAAAQSLASGE